MNQVHYVCTGSCQGMSDKPGVCGAEVCEMKGQPLKECDCEHPAHAEKLAKIKASKQQTDKQ